MELLFALLDTPTKVEIESPYHIYDMGPYEEGTSVSVTKFTFSENKEVEFVGTVKAEQEPKKHVDESFGMEIGEYEGVATFTQEIKTDNPDAKIKVMIEWQACGNGSCLPPAECELELTPKGSVSEASEDDEDEIEYISCGHRFCTASCTPCRCSGFRYRRT